MLKRLHVGTNVRVTLDACGHFVEGKVEGIERDENSGVSNIYLRSLYVQGIGIMTIDKKQIGREGFKVQPLTARMLLN